MVAALLANNWNEWISCKCSNWKLALFFPVIPRKLSLDIIRKLNNIKIKCYCVLEGNRTHTHIEGDVEVLLHCKSIRYVDDEEIASCFRLFLFLSAGGSISGAVFNPVLAFSVQFPCSGHSYLEYCFIYWLGPVLGKEHFPRLLPSFTEVLLVSDFNLRVF